MLAWEPRNVVKRRAHGTGNMATASDDSSQPRFGLDVPFCLVYMRVWFSGGTGSATLTLKQSIKDEPSGWYDQMLRQWLTCGTSGTAFVDFRVQRDEYPHWCYAAGDRLVPEWANPDSGNMAWSVEAGLASLGQ